MDLNINGITVIFPFKPYDIQIKYMSSIIEALQNRQNALLESPTGTGKTLSLLCSTLAWLEHRKFQDLDSIQIKPSKELPKFEDLTTTDSDHSQKKSKKTWKNDNPIRIIYSSRTHSQLNQACNELKNCYYKFCPSVTIGSRDQLCINPEVANLELISAKNQTCRYKVKNNLCSYHHNYERKVSDLSFCGSKIYDIEDLIKFGNEHKACPYYMSKALTDFNTSLTFMPYNYVLDPSIRKTLKLNLENSIIIFDEGHNIERVCEDSMSTELKSEWLTLFIKSFDMTLQALKDMNEGKYDGINEKDLSELNIHDVAKVKMTICDLEVELDNLVKKHKNTKGAHKTKEIFDIMEKINLDFERCDLICSVCEKILTFVMNSTVSFMTNQTIAALTSVCSFLEIIMPFINIKQGEFSKNREEFIKNYKLYTEVEQENNYKKTWLKSVSENGWTVYLWCMSPSVAISSLKRNGIYNLIITSGTLSPLESFECEMGIPFHVKLQNSHVISKNQLSIQLVLKDPNGHELCGSFGRRNDSKYYIGLGFTILEIARIVPKGVFIFFSSYSLINRCIEEWKAKSGVNLWTSISSVKKIFVEPRNKNEFNSNIDSFKYAVQNTPEGAIFMGVARGKLSEGIDMGDDYCRAVIIVGLPYPARYDPKVVLKQDYLNENNCKLNGIQWYMLQMKRALNQSIGRVIRHKNDYGMIILCDSRFQQLNDGFSKWILPFFNKNNGNVDFRDRIRQIRSFFSVSPFGENFKQSSDDEKSSDREKRQAKPTAIKNPFDKSAICNQNSGQLENIFNEMIENYTKVKDKNPADTKIFKKPSTNENHKSIFESFQQNSQPVIIKRKQFQNFLEDSTKKIRPILNQDEDPNKCLFIKKKTSPYFKKPFSSPVKVIENEQNDKTASATSSNSLEKNENLFDLESDEVIDIKNNILKTEHNIKTYHTIIDLIIYQPSKCRQLSETLIVYSKKQNSTYLALRLNFILDMVPSDKRASILKDFSMLVPERERKHFLRTCKVNIDP